EFPTAFNGHSFHADNHRVLRSKLDSNRYFLCGEVCRGFPFSQHFLRQFLRRLCKAGTSHHQKTQKRNYECTLHKRSPPRRGLSIRKTVFYARREHNAIGKCAQKMDKEERRSNLQ